MERILVLLLLCSGFSHFSKSEARRLRLLYNLNRKDDWENSQKECSDINGSLVTLYDEEDANFTMNYMNVSSWLGQRNGRNVTWLDGTALDDDAEELLENIEIMENQVRCVAIEGETPKAHDCSEKKRFVCKKNFRLSKRSKTWCQALHHCRTSSGSDLVSVADKQDLNRVCEAAQGGNVSSVWVGLMMGEWEWADGGCSAFTCCLNATSSQKQRRCMIVRTGDFRPWIHESQCNNVENIVCSKGVVRIRTVREPLTWERAYDYCEENHSGLLMIEDKEDQEAVEQWLRYADYKAPHGTFWVGLRQSRVFGFWIWKDQVANFANWVSHESAEPDGSYRCGVINQTDFKWRGLSCLEPRPFLCQEKIVFTKKNVP